MLDKCEKDAVEFWRAERIAYWSAFEDYPHNDHVINRLANCTAEELPNRSSAVRLNLARYRRERGRS